MKKTGCYQPTIDNLDENNPPRCCVENRMKVFACTDFQGYHIEGAAVVIAGNEHDARALLLDTLETADMKQRHPDSIRISEIPTTSEDVHILFDGDY